MELAENHGNNQENKNRNDRNRDYPIRSHPARVIVSQIFIQPHGPAKEP
jgi:hypothetical protein